MEVGGFGDEKIRCEIIEAKLMNPGIFKSKYSSFFIKTIPKGWVAERKFENFIELRNIITKSYPGYIVPPLPCKIEKKFEKEDIEKKKHYLQVFLNDLLKHPVLRNSNIFFQFLSLPSEKEYELKAKSHKKANPPKYVSDFHTFESSARVSYDNALTKYCSALNTGNSKLKDLYKEYY